MSEFPLLLLQNNVTCYGAATFQVEVLLQNSSESFRVSRGVIFLTLLLLASTVRADLKDNKKCKTIASTFVQMAEGLHVKPPTLDDELSEKTYLEFLSKLDPEKIILDADDVASLPYQTSLDEHLRSGDLEFPDAAIKLFRKNIPARLALIKKILDEREDFGGNEVLPANFSDLPFAKAGDEFEQHLRRILSFRRLKIKLAGDTDEAARAERVYHSIESALRIQNELSDLEVLEIFLNAFSASFDPHSHYFTQESAAAFEEIRTQRMFGIGVQLELTDDSTFKITELFEGAPDDVAANLKVGDELVEISADGTAENLRKVEGLSKNRVMSLLRGDEKKKDGVVLLTVKSSGSLKTVTLTRKHIDLKLFAPVARVDTIRSKRSGKDFKVGKIYLPTFGERSSEEVSAILTGADFKDIDLLLFDLRSNTGGSIQAARKLCGLFLEPKQIVAQVTSYIPGKTEPLTTGKGGIYLGPMVVVTNGGTASASELFTKAMVDYERALIVGNLTNGKNSIQSGGPVQAKFSFFPDPSDGVAVFTVALFKSSKDELTQVFPDVFLPALGDILAPRETDLPHTLATAAIAPPERVQFAPLRANSLERLKSIIDFVRLSERIDTIKTLKVAGVKPLNEKAALEQKALLVAKEDRDFLGEMIPLVATSRLLEKSRQRATPLPTFYNEEIESIGIDYLELIIDK